MLPAGIEGLYWFKKLLDGFGLRFLPGTRFQSTRTVDKPCRPFLWRNSLRTAFLRDYSVQRVRQRISGLLRRYLKKGTVITVCQPFRRHESTRLLGLNSWRTSQWDWRWGKEQTPVGQCLLSSALCIVGMRSKRTGLSLCTCAVTTQVWKEYSSCLLLCWTRGSEQLDRYQVFPLSLLGTNDYELFDNSSLASINRITMLANKPRQSNKT